jgi:hypothetical protein
MYVVEDGARTRRTVVLVFAVTVAAAVLVCVLAVLGAVFGPTALAVGGGGSAGAAAVATAVRKLSRPPTPWQLRLSPASQRWPGRALPSEMRGG